MIKFLFLITALTSSGFAAELTRPEIVGLIEKFAASPTGTNLDAINNAARSEAKNRLNLIVGLQEYAYSLAAQKKHITIPAKNCNERAKDLINAAGNTDFLGFEREIWITSQAVFEFRF